MPSLSQSCRCSATTDLTGHFSLDRNRSLFLFIKKNTNASKPCQPPHGQEGKNVKTFRWDYKLPQTKPLGIQSGSPMAVAERQQYNVGENLPLYCTPTLIAKQGYEKTETNDTTSLDTQLSFVTLGLGYCRMGVSTIGGKYV